MKGNVDRGIVHYIALRQALQFVILRVTNSKLHQKVGNDSIEMTLVVEALFEQFDSSIVSIRRPTLKRKRIIEYRQYKLVRKDAVQRPTHSLASEGYRLRTRRICIVTVPVLVSHRTMASSLGFTIVIYL